MPEPLAGVILQIARIEGLEVQSTAMEALVQQVGGDLRQVLNALQMWSKTTKIMSNADLTGRMKEVRSCGWQITTPVDQICGGA